MKLIAIAQIATGIFAKMSPKSLSKSLPKYLISPVKSNTYPPPLSK